MLYGAQTWATTKVIEKKIRSSYQKMLRHGHVGWEDRVPAEEVRGCGVKDIIEVLRSILRWYSHEKRREDDNVLRRATEEEVEGVRSR